MPNADPGPRYRDLTREEGECLLARNRVGRVACARGNRIEVIPLHLVFADGMLCRRTPHATRLEKTSRDLSKRNRNGGEPWSEPWSRRAVERAVEQQQQQQQQQQQVG